MSIRILLYDKNDRQRRSLERQIAAQPDLKVAGSFRHCLHLSAQLHVFTPEVVIMDLELPGLRKAEGIELIKRADPKVQVLIFTSLDDDHSILAGICAGADGYLLKDHSPVHLLAAIREVNRGGAPLSPLVSRCLLNACRREKKTCVDFGLTCREVQVLGCLVKGYTYQKIADICHISAETVRKHLHHAYVKLQVNCGTEAVAKALKYGIVPT